MARSLFLLGRHKLAIEAYKQADARTVYVSSSSQKADWEIYHNIGVCHMYLKQPDLALENLQQALDIHPNDQTYVIMGKVHLQMKNVGVSVA